MASFAAVALLIAGCVSPDRGTAIANDIRNANHPSVQKVAYGGDNDESGIAIWLQPGATKDDARAVVCEIVRPAVQRGSPPPDFAFDVLDSDGNVLASDLTPCP